MTEENDTLGAPMEKKTSSHRRWQSLAEFLNSGKDALWLYTTTDQFREQATKTDQYKKVKELLKEQGFVNAENIDYEVDWFYFQLGIDKYYFENSTAEKIVDTLSIIYAAKIMEAADQTKKLGINVAQEHDSHAFYCCDSQPGVSVSAGPMVERKIEKKYLDTSLEDKAGYRVQTYRSMGHVTTKSTKSQLRLYFVKQSVFAEGATDLPLDNCDVNKIGDLSFLRRSSDHTKKLYEDILKEAVKQAGPVAKIFEIENSFECRLVIAYKRNSTHSLFSSLSDLYHYYGLFSTRKYVEQFANGYTVVSLYLMPTPNRNTEGISHKEAMNRVRREVGLLFVLPRTSLQPMLQDRTLSIQEVCYAYCGWKFAYHFMERYTSELITLNSVLNMEDSTHLSLLAKIKSKLGQDTFTETAIKDTIFLYPDLIKKLYGNFQGLFQPKGTKMRQSLEKVSGDEIMEKETSHIRDIIRTKNFRQEFHQGVFETFLLFNQMILKTNFYKPTRTAISFRLNPDFLPTISYPNKPFGVFFVIGGEFRGFHIRFRDVARGGIRMIRSRNFEAYHKNMASLFNENYDLASTQQRKNKDIPEGGAKGTILLTLEYQHRAKPSFEKVRKKIHERKRVNF